MIVRKYISEFFVAVSILAGNCPSVLLLDFRTCLISNGLLRFFTQTCYHSCDSMGLLLLSCVFTGTLLVLCCTYRGTLLYISIHFAIYLHKIVTGYWITGASSQNKRAADAKFAGLLGCS